MSATPLKIMIAAGEVSGDMYGGALIRALRERFPGRELDVRGMGGDALRAEGAQLLYHTDALAAMGIIEVLAKIRFYKRVLADMVALAAEWRPDLLITLDYYSFNIALAERVKALGIRTAHYISPKVWVWRRGRIKRIARAFDLLLCIFPFEIRALLPTFLEAARRVQTELGGDCSFILPAPTPKMRALAESILAKHPVPDRLAVVDGRARHVMAQADCAMIASGTATLEACLMDCPALLAYRVSLPTELLARLITLKAAFRYAGLVNIVANRLVMPELLQRDCTPVNAARITLDYLRDTPARRDLLAAYAEVRDRLGPPGATARAAAALAELL